MLGLPGPRLYRTDDNPNGDFEDAVGHARHNGHSYFLRERMTGPDDARWLRARLDGRVGR